MHKKYIKTGNILIFLLIGLIQGAQARGPNISGGSTVSAAGYITGVIHDSTTDGPIEYATVGLYRQSDSVLVNGTVTDNSGAFMMKGLPNGQYYLEASFIGFNKKTISNIILTPQSHTLDLGVIALHINITKIADVQVIAQSQRVEYKIDKKVVNVSQDISAAGGSLVNVLENTPSVQVDVEGNVSLRGSGNFQLLIDGKPSVIQGSEGLQQIPASAVQSLEIITSPSAKFDPDGAAGIINVIMKKQKNTGVGGVVNASIGTREKYTTDFLINFRKKKINYFIGAEYADFNNFNNGEGERRTYAGDTTTYQLTRVDGVFSRQSLNLKTGFDYNLSDKSTFSLSGAVNNRTHDRDFESLNHWYDEPFVRDSFYRENSISSDKDLFYNLNLDFQKKYDENGHMLQASVYFAAGNEEETEDDVIRLTDDEYVVTGQEPARTRSDQSNSESNWKFELDYTKPLGTGKLEMGLQSRWDIDEADYIYKDYQPLNNEWIRNDTISNSLNYRDALQSAYGMYNGPLGKFEYQLGLRAEYDNRRLEQITNSETFTYQKFHFFPSFYIIRKLSDSHQFQFTYTRRIQRPDERDLNPFKEFRGSSNVFYGNPALTPEFTNSLELNYQYTFKKGFVSLETYYRGTTDKITRITGVDTLNGKQVFTNTTTNADSDHSLGIEIMTNVDLTRWWQLNLTGNLYRYQLEGDVEGDQVTTVSTTWRANYSTMFRVGKNTRFQLMGFYNGPSSTLQGKRDGFFVTNAAVRRDFLNKQLTVSLNARDVFASGKFAFTAEGTSFYAHNKFWREAPVVTLNLSYRINNYRQTSRKGMNEQGEESNGMDMGM
jgi:outer membrane receptor protein involved in Fe transport